MVHGKELDHTTLLAREAHTLTHGLGQFPTAVDMRGASGANVFPQIVQQQRKFQQRLIGGLVIETRQGLEERRVRFSQALEHLNTPQGVFIDCVTMVQVVLYQAGKRIKLGDISAKQPVPMHRTQHRSRMRLRQDAKEHGSCFRSTTNALPSKQPRLGFQRA